MLEYPAGKLAGFFMTHEFVESLSRILRESGSSLTVDELRRLTKECRDEIYSDDIAHKGNCDGPFFNFVIAGGVAVFTFFESEFSVYVLPCTPTQLIADTNRLAMGDVADCRQYLAAKHGKTTPDLVVSRSVSEYWLETSS
jgi:hypothetical protein